MKNFMKNFKNFLLESRLADYNLDGTIHLYHYSKSDEYDFTLDPDQFVSNTSSHSRKEKEISDDQIQVVPITEQTNNNEQKSEFDYAEEIKVESLSLHDKELELIKKSLEKHKGRRKLAAKELGISERTLYRKIKQSNL